MNKISIPKGANRVTYKVIGFAMKHAPEYPERTSMRAVSDGIEYCQWATRSAMLKAVDMQPKHRKMSSQWKPVPIQEGRNP